MKYLFDYQKDFSKLGRFVINEKARSLQNGPIYSRCGNREYILSAYSLQGGLS